MAQNSLFLGPLISKVSLSFESNSPREQTQRVLQAADASWGGVNFETWKALIPYCLDLT